VGGGILVGHGPLLVGRQAFLILLNIRISDINFIKNIKSHLCQLQKLPETKNESILIQLKV